MVKKSEVIFIFSSFTLLLSMALLAVYLIVWLTYFIHPIFVLLVIPVGVGLSILFVLITNWMDEKLL